MEYKARYKTNSDTEYQLLTTHLAETAMYVELFSKKIGLIKPAILTALTHDLGKNCNSWQKYLNNSHITSKKSIKEDHGTAGGQYLYNNITKNPVSGNELVAQLLAACVMYHHGSGLPDIISPDGTAPLSKRLNKPEEETHMEEAASNLETSIKQKINEVLSDTDFITDTMNIIKPLTKSKTEESERFYLGLTARFLSSCLIDGDRRSSAFFDKGIPVKMEDAVVKADWKVLLDRLETHLAGLSTEGNLNEIRRDISRRCTEFAARGNGIFTLTAATGAGKTLASLRYALTLAQSTGKDHIFIIAPYTSILDQNADVIRGILDPNGKNGDIILEHHSNLEQSEKTEHSTETSETWNVPIIITTMVQFLEAIFGSGTRKIRRMHQLANSVIILDEVQTLPLSCTYLFSWALQYLYQNAHVSFLLTTATQPGLDKLKPEYALPLTAANEIIPNIARHFEELKRIDLIDETTDIGWTLGRVTEFIEELDEQSILTVVNTKAQARKLYNDLSSNHSDWNIIHLSANMCPAHRRSEISKLKVDLKNKAKKCICISTRLIEAGVDIDFDCAIRFLAGFDSIIQTGGRCNRSGGLKDSQGNLRIGKTFIINIIKDEENISSLPELIHGQEKMKRILGEFRDNEEMYNHDLMHPGLIMNYFRYYYDEMPDSLLKYKISELDDTILDLLSKNSKNTEAFKLKIVQENCTAKPHKKFRQSFETAWKNFEVISQDTIGVIVPFERGVGIIAELYAKPEMERCIELLQEAQQYSVNVYSNMIDKMISEKIIHQVDPKSNFLIYTVNEKYYDLGIGLTDVEGKMTSKIV